MEELNQSHDDMPDLTDEINTATLAITHCERDIIDVKEEITLIPRFKALMEKRRPMWVSIFLLPLMAKAGFMNENERKKGFKGR